MEAIGVKNPTIVKEIIYSALDEISSYKPVFVRSHLVDLKQGKSEYEMPEDYLRIVAVKEDTGEAYSATFNTRNLVISPASEWESATSGVKFNIYRGGVLLYSFDPFNIYASSYETLIALQTALATYGLLADDDDVISGLISSVSTEYAISSFTDETDVECNTTTDADEISVGDYVYLKIDRVQNNYHSGIFEVTAKPTATEVQIDYAYGAGSGVLGTPTIVKVEDDADSNYFNVLKIDLANIDPDLDGLTFDKTDGSSVYTITGNTASTSVKQANHYQLSRRVVNEEMINKGVYNG